MDWSSEEADPDSKVQHAGKGFIAARDEKEEDMTVETSAEVTTGDVKGKVQDFAMNKQREVIPLPTFSRAVSEILASGDSSTVWNLMINECVNYYCNTAKDYLKDSHDYRMLGKEIFKNSPV